MRPFLIQQAIRNFRDFLSIVLRLPQYLRLSWRLMKDPGVSRVLKLIVVAAILYGVSPLDLIPEAFIPPLGFAEDVILLLLALRMLIRLSPKEIVTRHAREISASKRKNSQT